MTMLRDLCEAIVDCEHKTAPIQDEGYPSIRTPNIGRGYFLLEGVNRVSEETYAKWTKREVPQSGDLILAREAPVGNVAVIPDGESFCLGQRTVLIRPDKRCVDSNYLCYLLLTSEMQGRMRGKSGGATVHHLNLKDIRAMEMPDLPVLREQMQRASVIKAYDDLIATNQRRIALLEDATRRLYGEWFVHLRFPGHESVPVKDGVPQGWQWLNLGEVCDAVGGGTPSTSRLDYWGGDVIWVTPTDVTRNDCLVLLDSEKKITESGLANSSAKLVPPDTILMTSRASIGFFALMDKSSCTNQGFISVLPKHANSRMFLLFNLQCRVEEMIGLATGATFKELSKKTFRALPVLWPADQLLQSFEEQVYPWIQQVRLFKKQNQQLTRARDLLLPKLMSGQLDVSGIALPGEAAA